MRAITDLEEVVDRIHKRDLSLHFRSKLEQSATQPSHFRLLREAYRHPLHEVLGLLVLEKISMVRPQVRVCASNPCKGWGTVVIKPHAK
jgi:hypothetical protein